MQEGDMALWEQASKLVWGSRGGLGTQVRLPLLWKRSQRDRSFEV